MNFTKGIKKKDIKKDQSGTCTVNTLGGQILQFWCLTVSGITVDVLANIHQPITSIKSAKTTNSHVNVAINISLPDKF